MQLRSTRPAQLPLAALPFALLACQAEVATPTDGAAHDAQLAERLGAHPDLTVELIAGGLQNPSWVSFSPEGVLTVCDSGHGRVAQVVDGELTDYITGFPTEYWKVDAESGAQRFQLGPLSAAWMGSTLVVTDAGRKDG